MVPRPGPGDARPASDTPLPPSSPAPPPCSTAVALEIELTATVDHAALARRRFRVWLVGLTTDLDLVEDLVLAVYEALANAVDHAYLGVVDPGVVTLHAEVTDTRPDGSPQPGQVHIRVTDRGVWHLPPDDPGRRGRGLELMRGLTDTLRLEHAPTGTTVHLHRHLGPDPTTPGP